MLINGVSAESIDVSDRGLQYGDGLFETIAVEAGRPLFIKEHFNRLGKGCELLGFGDFDQPLIEKEIRQQIAGNLHGVIKLILTRAGVERGFLAPKNAYINRIVSFERRETSLIAGIKKVQIGICQTRLSQQPLLAGIKHLSQIERVLARSEWDSPIIKESLMLDVQGDVIEGTMSNFFIVKDNVLKTADLSQCGIDGVMRNFIINKAQSENRKIEVSCLTLDNVLDADEVFLTNSLMPIWFVEKINYQSKEYSFIPADTFNWAFDNINMELKKQAMEKIK